MSEKISLPRLFLTMEDGLITKWYKNKGDKVAEGEILFSVEAEKASLDVESPISGILAQILIQEGEIAEVGADIAIIVGENENYEEIAVQEKKVNKENMHAETQKTEAVDKYRQEDSFSHSLRITPKARAMVKEMKIDLSMLGKKYGNIRITEKEIYEFSNGTKSGAASIDISHDFKGKKIKISSVRRSIAKKMSQSLSKAAQLTNGIQVDMTDMFSIIKELKAIGKEISVTGCIIKACAGALKEHPKINCKYLEEDEEILLEANINIGFAVDISEGLLVPVIKDADKKDVFQISGEILMLSEKAKKGEIIPSDIQDGTFTVSNVGMYEIFYFTPIINYPESAILGIGAAKKIPVYSEGSNNFEPRYIGMLNLSYDHRVIDGAPASRFLLSIKKNVENIKNIVS